MRNLLALFAFALLTFAGAGWYLDWYKFQTNKTPDGVRHVDIDIHGDKITEDLHRGSEKLHDAWERRPRGESGSASAPTEKRGS